MCTAVTYQTRDFYFGRTLDHDNSYCSEITITPRNFPIPLRHGESIRHHYAIIGMAHVVDDFPLYFDGVNEKGLAMAGLNFPGFACYGTVRPDRENIAVFELIPWILGRCSTTAEAREKLEKLNLTDTPFSPSLPPAQLHWILADRHQALTIEATEDGLKIYDNPMGVLTNNPPFPQQLLRLQDYVQLSPEDPVNRLCPELFPVPYSLGLGAMGLPGDLSSPSRFARAVFMKLHSQSDMSENESVSQFFHILGTVTQPRGCCRTGNGTFELTQYTCCCNTDKGIYYCKTYDDHQITGVSMYREKLDDSFLIRYPLNQNSRIPLLNQPG